MKNILIVLSICVIFAFILALDRFGSHLNHQANHASNIQNPIAHLRDRRHRQQQNHLDDTDPAHDQNNININESASINHVTSSDHQEDLYEQNDQQTHPSNSIDVDHQGDINNDASQNITASVNKHDVHPKFRYGEQNGRSTETESPLLTTTTTTTVPSSSNTLSDLSLLSDSKSIIDTTKSWSLLQIFTKEITNNSSSIPERVPFADYYYQQQLRAFFGHRHGKFAPRTRSYIKTGLKR
ncbi:unnamed protein product [Adineta steineri]|uniref:Uncharacterized protein n=1 Tax=Adineta steineri TaxID=433720 RepID=A0A814PQ50_9BILA|nr:unnamed protein product [Adineta steineri]CAF3991329.1 unnamed protein product [Adineta steineri]